MSDLKQIMDGMTAVELVTAVRILDAISRPLTVREIETFLRAKGVPRSRAVITAASIKKLSIIALVGPEVRADG